MTVEVVNRAPAFARATATRRVSRNALVGSNVSPAVRAEDPDGDDLTYTLTGSGDEEWFTVVGTSGQLRVAKPLEKQVGESYQLTLTADDGKGGTGQVAVTVKVVEANRAPAFESATATRRVPRNALVGHKLRPAVRAEDPDGDDLTYTLTGSGDEEWFTVVGTSGQLQVAKPLEKQAGESYQLTLTADDGKGGTGQVAVTVEVVNRAPAFESATATRRVPRNALVGSNVGPAVRAEDPDDDDLTYTLTGSGDEEWFTVVGTSGQLRVAKPLEKQVGESYQLTLTADDGKGGTGQVAVTVEVVNRAPAFARATATRRVSRNALVGSNVSTAVRAEDPDGDDLTYTLTGSGDEEWFTVVGTSGQLRVAKPLEKQVGESYQLTLTADDGKGGTGQVAVTVKVVEANRAPAFESATATRRVPRNALVGHKLRPAVRAEDPDGDDLTYTLTGSGDEEWFTVVGTSGQLQVAKPLEKQAGESYQLTLTADDSDLPRAALAVVGREHQLVALPHLLLQRLGHPQLPACPDDGEPLLVAAARQRVGQIVAVRILGPHRPADIAADERVARHAARRCRTLESRSAVHYLDSHSDLPRAALAVVGRERQLVALPRLLLQRLGHLQLPVCPDDGEPLLVAAARQRVGQIVAVRILGPHRRAELVADERVARHAARRCRTLESRSAVRLRHFDSHSDLPRAALAVVGRERQLVALPHLLLQRLGHPQLPACPDDGEPLLVTAARQRVGQIVAVRILGPHRRADIAADERVARHAARRCRTRESRSAVHLRHYRSCGRELNRQQKHC